VQDYVNYTGQSTDNASKVLLCAGETYYIQILVGQDSVQDLESYSAELYLQIPLTLAQVLDEIGDTELSGLSFLDGYVDSGYTDEQTYYFYSLDAVPNDYENFIANLRTNETYYPNGDEDYSSVLSWWESSQEFDPTDYTVEIADDYMVVINPNGVGDFLVGSSSKFAILSTATFVIMYFPDVGNQILEMMNELANGGGEDKPSTGDTATPNTPQG
jgi:hypothetical protein